MLSIEVTPGRGAESQTFEFKITGAPLPDKQPRPPYTPDQYLIWYLEAPVGHTVVTRWFFTKDATIRFNPHQAFGGQVPEPWVPGWDRWVCFVFEPKDFMEHGDVGATPLASAVMVLNP